MAPTCFIYYLDFLIMTEQSKNPSDILKSAHVKIVEGVNVDISQGGYSSVLSGRKVYADMRQVDEVELESEQQAEGSLFSRDELKQQNQFLDEDGKAVELEDEYGQISERHQISMQKYRQGDDIHHVVPGLQVTNRGSQHNIVYKETPSVQQHQETLKTLAALEGDIVNLVDGDTYTYQSGLQTVEAGAVDKTVSGDSAVTYYDSVETEVNGNASQETPGSQQVYQGAVNTTVQQGRETYYDGEVLESKIALITQHQGASNVSAGGKAVISAGSIIEVFDSCSHMPEDTKEGINKRGYADNGYASHNCYGAALEEDTVNFQQTMSKNKSAGVCRLDSISRQQMAVADFSLTPFAKFG